MTTKTNNAAAKTNNVNNLDLNIDNLVKCCIAVVDAQEQLCNVAANWHVNEFTVDHAILFSAEYRAAYLKRFQGKTAEQATSAVTSAMTSVRLAMWRAGKQVFVKKGKKIVPWEPSKALLKARNLLPADDTPPATPPATPATANITKDAALESINRVIAFCNTQKLTVKGHNVIAVLTAIGRAIDAMGD